MPYQITSLIAFEEILCNLGERQKLVLQAIKKIQPANNLMIANYLHLPINCITGRMQELRKKGLVINYKSAICPYTNRLTIYWKCPEWINGVLA